MRDGEPFSPAQLTAAGALLLYLYTSYANATAFSPTDTLPLSAMAKLLMAAQSLTALVAILVVVARAVNALG